MVHACEPHNFTNSQSFLRQHMNADYIEGFSLKNSCGKGEVLALSQSCRPSRCPESYWNRRHSGINRSKIDIIHWWVTTRLNSVEGQASRSDERYLLYWGEFSVLFVSRKRLSGTSAYWNNNDQLNELYESWNFHLFARPRRMDLAVYVEFTMAQSQCCPDIPAKIGFLGPIKIDAESSFRYLSNGVLR